MTPPEFPAPQPGQTQIAFAIQCASLVVNYQYPPPPDMVKQIARAVTEKWQQHAPAKVLELLPGNQEQFAILGLSREETKNVARTLRSTGMVIDHDPAKEHGSVVLWFLGMFEAWGPAWRAEAHDRLTKWQAAIHLQAVELTKVSPLFKMEDLPGFDMPEILRKK